MTSADQPHDDPTARFWSRYRAAGSSSAGAEPGGPPGASDPARSGASDPGRSSGQDEPGPSPDPSDPGGPAPGEPGAGHGDGDRCLDWCPICRGAERLETAIPPELADQLRLVQRDALLLARAAIDAHLARFEDRAPRPGGRPAGSGSHGDHGGPEPSPPSGEDIPIE